MTDLAKATVLPSVALQAQKRVPRDKGIAYRPKGAVPMPNRTVPMDTFKWVVSGLLGALVVGIGWFLSGIQSDLREIRKEVAGIRVEAAVASTKLEDLIAEFRRRYPR